MVDGYRVQGFVDLMTQLAIERGLDGGQEIDRVWMLHPCKRSEQTESKPIQIAILITLGLFLEKINRTMEPVLAKDVNRQDCDTRQG